MEHITQLKLIEYNAIGCIQIFMALGFWFRVTSFPLSWPFSLSQWAYLKTFNFRNAVICFATFYPRPKKIGLKENTVLTSLTNRNFGGGFWIKHYQDKSIKTFICVDCILNLQWDFACEILVLPRTYCISPYILPSCIICRVSCSFGRYANGLDMTISWSNCMLNHWLAWPNLYYI